MSFRDHLLQLNRLPSLSQRERRDGPGYFSSARVFSLQPGSRVGHDSVRGYYIDLRAKASRSGWPTPWARRGASYVPTCQWGLGSYERYLESGDEVWLGWALDVGEHLLGAQEADGSWRHEKPFPHTFSLPPGWVSGMAQGEGASLLVRLFLENGDGRFAAAARTALRPLTVPSADGGAMALLGGVPFPEEYPTVPPAFVLNGGIFGLWGLRDVAIGLEDPDVARRFEESVDALAANLHRWDTGYWTRYDLHPHPVVNVASSFYHALHISQIRAMNAIAGRPEFEAAVVRWEQHAARRANRLRAISRKVLFRVVVPRNARLAERVPWGSGRRTRSRS